MDPLSQPQACKHPLGFEDWSDGTKRCAFCRLTLLTKDLEVAREALRRLGNGADHSKGIVAAEFYEGISWAQDIAKEALQKLSKP